MPASKQTAEELQAIPLEQVRVPEIFQKYRKSLFNEDGTPNFEGVEGLAESVEAKGLLTPVLLKDLGNNAYELIFGLRRLRAHQLLLKQGKKSFSTITARVVKFNAERSLASMFVENDQRKSPTFAALCAIASELEPKMDSGKIAEYLLVPPSTVRHALSLWKKAIQEVKDALSEGLITRSEATELAKKPRAVQLEALTELLASDREAPPDEGRKERVVRRREAAGIPDEGSTLPSEKRLKVKDYVNLAEHLILQEDVPYSRPVADAFLVSAGKMPLAEFLLTHFSTASDTLQAFGVKKPRKTQVAPTAPKTASPAKVQAAVKAQGTPSKVSLFKRTSGA